MKKSLTLLSVLLLLTASVTMGQTQTNTQFPNPGFEYWVNHPDAEPYKGVLGWTNYGYITKLPYNWHTFDEANATILGSGTAKKTHHKQASGRTGNYSMSIYCATVLSVPANGAVSTGQTKIGSMTAGSSDNYNYSNPSQSSDFGVSGYMTWEFVGCPDSMSFYYKTSYSSQQPLFKVFLHKSGEFRDRANGTLFGESNVKLIGSSVDTFSTSSSWAREVFPFTYSTPGQGGDEYTFLGQTSSVHSTYGYYTSINRPDMMLASFSTSKTAGTGSDQDHMEIDDLWCIYDKGLKSLTLDESSNSTALNYFNSQEWLTHEPSRTYDGQGNPSFNNSGSATWNYPTSFCYSSDADFPQIAATPKSKLITNFVITQATTSTKKATIVVTHNDGSTFTYIIDFASAAHQAPTVTLSSNNSQTVCSGSPINAITVSTTNATSTTASNLPAGLTYNATTGKITGNPTTTANYTITASNDGCSSQATGTITVLSVPTATISQISGSTTISCGGSTTLTARTTASGNKTFTWSPATGLSSTTGQTVTASPTTTTTYTVTLLVDNGTCSASSSKDVTITVNGASVGTLSVEGNTSICSGSSTTLTASTTGSTGTVTYAWSPSTGLNTTTGATVTASPTTSTTYTVTATATQSVCTATDTKEVSITVNPVPAVTLSSNKNQTVCAGTAINAITVTATNGTATVSNLPSGLTFSSGKITGTPTVSGTYTVTVASDNCGTATATGTITVNPVPAVTLSSNSTQAVCAGTAINAITVTATNGTATVSNLPNGVAYNTTTGKITGTPTASGTYTVTVASANCGSATATGTITVNPVPAVTLSSNSTQAVCAGTAINAITVTATNGTATVSNLPSGLTFSSGKITGTPTASGTYTVTVTSDDCGTATATGTITVNPVPAVTLSSNSTQAVCAGTAINAITVTATNGTATVPDLPSGLTFSSGKITGTPTASGTYTVTVTSDDCGTATATGTITVNPVPAVTLSDNSTQAVCAGTAINAITVTATNGTAMVSNLPNGLTFSSGKITGTPTASGTYTVTVTSDDCGTATATGTITVNPVPAVTLSNNKTQTVCAGTAINEITVTATNGTATVSNLPNGLTFSSGKITGTPTASGTYTVTVTSDDCGTATATGTITVNTPNAGTISVAGTTTICNGGSTTLTASATGNTGTMTYAWTPNTGLDATTGAEVTANPTSSTTYTVTGTATNTVNSVACTATATKDVTVTVNDPNAGTINVAGTTTICNGGSTTLTASATGSTGTMTYAWSPSTGLDATTGAEVMANPTSTTTYTVTGTATVGSCTATATKQVTVTVNTPNAGTINVAGTTTICKGNSTTLTASATGNTGTMTYAWSPSSGLSSTTGAQVTANPTSTTTYTVTGTATNTVNSVACTATATKQVTVAVNAPNAGTINVTGNNTICKGNSTTLTASATGNTGTMTYAWSPNTGLNTTTGAQVTANPTTTTTYTITGTATVGSCTATATKQVTVTVNNPVAGTITLTGNTTICKGNSTTLTASTTGNTGTVAYAWSPSTGLNTTSGAQVTATPTATTTYTVTATATIGSCTASTTKQVTVTVNNPVAGTITLTGNTTICKGNSTTLTASTTGNTGTVAFAWSPSTGLNTTSGAQVTATPSATTTYTVTATATVGACTASTTKQVTVTVNNPIAGTINVTGNTTICKGNSTTLTASATGNSGTMTYAWSPSTGLSATTGNQVTANPTSTTTYTVTGTATIGACTATATKQVTVTVNNPIAGTINVAGNTTICNGQNTTLTASASDYSGAMTYVWTPNTGLNTTTGAEVTAAPTTTTTYTVTGTATIGACTATATKEVTVTVNNLPTVEISGTTTFCQGNTETLSATEGYSYLWDDNSTNRSIDVTTSGTYSVTVTDDNGCQNHTSVEVTVLPTPAAPTATTENNTSCTSPNGSLTVTAPLGSGYTYSIGGAFQSATTFTNLSAGTYTLTVKNADACTASSEIEVEATGNNVDAHATATTPCAGGTIALTGTSTTEGVTYAWSGPNGFTSAEQNPQITSATAANAGTYTLVVTETATNCTKNATVNVQVNTPAVALADIADKTVCADDDITLNAALDGTATGTVTYSWTGPNSFMSADQNPQIENITAANAGTYTVVATATNVVNGVSCTAFDTKSFELTVNTPAIALEDMTAKSVCMGSQLDLAAVTTGTTTGTPTFAWTGPNDFTSAQQNPSIASVTADNEGTYTVVATATNTVNGKTCTATDTKTVEVTVNALPNVTISGATTFCAGMNTDLTALGAVSYLWSPGGQETETITVVATDNISVEGTDANGCKNTASVSVVANTPAVRLADMDAIKLCENEDIELAAILDGTPTGDVTYTWSGPNDYTSTQQNNEISAATPSHSGTYTVVATATKTLNELTCTATDTKTVDVTVNALPNVTINGVTTICAGTTTELTATGATSYVWSNDGETASITVDAAGEYSVEGTDENGCKNNASVNVEVNTPAVKLNAMDDIILCEGAALNLAASLNGTPTGNVTYVWSGPNSYTSTQQNNEISAATPSHSGTYTVVATATNVLNDLTCTATDTKTVNVTVNALPAVPVLTVVDNTSCTTPNGSITVTSPVGSEYVYALNNGTYQATALFDGLDAGSYTVSVKISETGCTSEANANVETQGSTMDVEIAVDDICAGGDAAFESTVTDATGDVTYAWSGPNDFTSTEQNPTITNVTTANAGTYTLQVTETATHCRVTATTTLTVNVPHHTATTTEACFSYEWNGTLYEESGDYTYAHEDANGCQQVDTLHLTVYPPANTAETVVACDSYEWHGTTYETSGNYTYTHVGAHGCQQVDTLHLTINTTPVVTITGETSIITGNSTTLTASGADSYVWSTDETTAAITVAPTTNTTYTVVGTTNECSTDPVEVVVIVNDCVPGYGDTTAIACDEFTWYGTTYTASTETPTHVFAGVMPDGCDSIVTLHLTINKSTTGIDEKVACDSYEWIDGNTYTESTNEPTFTLTNAAGCDSVVTLHLTINKSTTGIDEKVACDSYTWIDDVTYTESTNEPTVTLTNAAGCDSIVTLHLTINKSTTGIDEKVACDSYTWIDDVTYTESTNEPTFTLTNAVGCDSVVTLHLTINKSTTGIDEKVACDSYKWIDGNTYTESTNEPTFTLTNAAGCDSVVTLHLTINKSTTGIDEKVACDSYKWIDGNTYTESTNEPTFTLTNAAGCDSVVTLHLTINKSTTGIDEKVACDSYKWIDGNTYTESTNEPTYTLTNAAGCDSVVTLHLTINKSTTGIDEKVACDSYTWIDDVTYTESTNEPTFTLTNAAGCDSIVTLHLTINKSTTGIDEKVACDTYTWIDGNTYTESTNEPTFTLTNAAGCDSVVTLHLTINKSTTGIDEKVACDVFKWIDGNAYTESTNEPTFTLTNAAGCDSVVTLHLTINKSTTGIDEKETCDTYTWIDGNTYTESTNEPTFTLTNAAGCDSVVTLHLTINKSTTGIDEKEACDHFTWIDGVTYTESTNEPTYTLTNAAGCDSVVTLHLTIKNSLTGIDEQVACDSYTWIDGVTYTESTNEPTFTLTSTNGCDSVVTLHLTVNKSTTGIDEQVACGQYTWIDGLTYTESTNEPTFTLTNAAGCDSVVTLHLTINYEVHKEINEHGCDSYVWDGDVYTESGDYVKTYSLENGCDSIVTLHLNITPSYYIEIKDTICEGALYARYNFMETEAGDYTQNLQTATGCDSVVVLHLATKECTSNCGEDVQDVDGNTYGTKALNSLCWMTSNLRTTRYSDGTTIPMAIVYSYPYDANNTTNLETYGRLYDWASASKNEGGRRSPEIQGACPYGWRLPSQSEYNEWATAYTMDQLRSTTNWLIENGNNASGFNMQPGGFFNSNTQRCEELHGKAYFYTSDYSNGTQDVVHMVAQCGCWELLFIRDRNLNDAYSVRCVKDIE